MEILIINLIDMYSLIERLVFVIENEFLIDYWPWITFWMDAIGHSWIFTKISLFFAVNFVSCHFTNELFDSCQLLNVSLQTKLIPDWLPAGKAIRKKFLIDFECSIYLLLIDNCSQGCYFKTFIKTAVKLASNVNFDSYSQQVTSK